MLKYLVLTFFLFLISLWGIFITRKNFIVILLSIEIMLLAINLNFIVFSNALSDIFGQLFALVVLTVAASESAIGLALLIIAYRVMGLKNVDYISMIKG